MKDAKPNLVEFWAQYYNQDIYRAFYEGIGLNLSTGIYAADTDCDYEQGLGIKNVTIQIGFLIMLVEQQLMMLGQKINVKQRQN